MAEGLERPQLGPIATGLGEVFHYVVRSTDTNRTPTELRVLQDWVVKPELRKVPGVAEVNTWGGFEKQYHVVVETARRLTPLNVDLLTAEFPLDVGDTDESKWMDACRALSAASHAPWILLSAAVDYETFLRQVTVACNAGASGVAAGRAVWKEAVTLVGNERQAFLRTTATHRISRLTYLCHALARPFTEFYEANPPFDWYNQY